MRLEELSKCAKRHQIGKWAERKKRQTYLKNVAQLSFRVDEILLRGVAYLQCALGPPLTQPYSSQDSPLTTC